MTMRIYTEKASITVTLFPTVQIFRWHSHRVQNHVTKRHNVLEIKLLFLKYTIILEIESKKQLDKGDKSE
jgi:hypothetical protein